MDAAGGCPRLDFPRLSQRRRSATARSALSTFWPPMPVPRWGSDGPSCLSPCSAYAAPPSRGPARSSMSVLPPAAGRVAPAVVFCLCRSPRGAQRPLGPGNHLGAPRPWHATTFPTPPPFPQRTEVPWDPALPRVADDPGLSASPTAGVPVPHVPPPLQGQATVTPAFYPPRTSESPGFHASPTAGRVLPNIAFSPTRLPPSFIVQPRGGALA